jgi:hypothetical protein
MFAFVFLEVRKDQSSIAGISSLLRGQKGSKMPNVWGHELLCSFSRDVTKNDDICATSLLFRLVAASLHLNFQIPKL